MPITVNSSIFPKPLLELVSLIEVREGTKQKRAQIVETLPFTQFPRGSRPVDFVHSIANVAIATRDVWTSRRRRAQLIKHTDAGKETVLNLAHCVQELEVR